MLLALQCIYQINILFIYRFAQTTENRFLQQFMSNSKYVLAIFVVSFILFLFGFVVPLHESRLSVDQVEKYIRENLTIITEKFPARIIVGIEVSICE